MELILGSPPGAGRCRSLPEDVVELVLARLELRDLWAARLVCTVWRRASFIPTIRVAPALLILAPSRAIDDPAQMHPDSLASRLAAQPSIRIFALVVHRPALVPLLRLPDCRAALQSLDIDFFVGELGGVVWPRRPGDVRGAGAHWLEGSDLEGVGALTRLRVAAYRDCTPPSEAEATVARGLPGLLAQCTGLRVLDLECSKRTWVQLVEHLPGLAHLQDLGHVPLGSLHVQEHVARLTALTALRDHDGGITEDPLLYLASGLPALRVLSLGRCFTTSYAGIERLAQSMTRLEALRLEECDTCRSSHADRAALFSALPRLTSLAVSLTHVLYDPLETLWRGAPLAGPAVAAQAPGMGQQPAERSKPGLPASSGASQGRSEPADGPRAGAVRGQADAADRAAPESPGTQMVIVVRAEGRRVVHGLPGKRVLAGRDVPGPADALGDAGARLRAPLCQRAVLRPLPGGADAADAAGAVGRLRRRLPLGVLGVWWGLPARRIPLPGIESVRVLAPSRSHGAGVVQAV